MKSFLSFLLLVCSFGATSQSIHVDSTRFITGNRQAVLLKNLITTADGGLFFTGSDYGNPGGIIPYFPDTDGNANVLVGKMDSHRQISWIKVFGGSDDDFGVTACEVPDGGYAVLADGHSADIDVTDHKGSNDIWMLRLDANGNVLWKKSYGSYYSDIPNAIANTPDGGFVILGTTNGSDGDVPFHYGGYFEVDWLVIKTDALGNVEWSRNLGTTADEYIECTILAIDDAYYLLGATPGKGYDCTDTAWHSGVLTGYDCYILKIDAGGTVLWNKSYGGSNGESIFHAFYDTRDSTIMIAGRSYSSDYMLTENFGNSDFWVMKVKKDGSMVWQKSFGTAGPDGATSICAAATGGYMIYGRGPSAIELTDLWVIMTDINGNELTSKVIGGVSHDNAGSIIPYSGGYAISGFSTSVVFTEGVTYGRIAPYQNGFISFIDVWPLEVDELQASGKGHLVFAPNPATGTTRFEVQQAGSTGTLTILNAMGATVHSARYGASTIRELTTAHWPAGVYIARWVGDDGAVSSGTVAVR